MCFLLLNPVSENLVGPLTSSFAIGKPVRVRVVSVDVEKSYITASIRRAAPSFDIADISAVEIGTNVEGVVVEIHKDNAVLSLKQSNIRALLSLKNLANHRSLSLPQLRTSLTAGEELSTPLSLYGPQIFWEDHGYPAPYGHIGRLRNRRAFPGP